MATMVAVLLVDGPPNAGCDGMPGGPAFACSILFLSACASCATQYTADFPGCGRSKQGLIAQMNSTARYAESEALVAHLKRTTCSAKRCPDSVEPNCAVSPPGLDYLVSPRLSPRDFQGIVDVVGRGQSVSIIRIENWSANDGRDQPTPAADQVLTVTVWGGYNKCLHFGRNLGFVVEKVGGSWRRVGRSARFVEYMH